MCGGKPRAGERSRGGGATQVAPYVVVWHVGRRGQRFIRLCVCVFAVAVTCPTRGFAALAGSASKDRGGRFLSRHWLPRSSQPRVPSSLFPCSGLSFKHVCETYATLTSRYGRAQNTFPVHAGVLLGRPGRFQVPVRLFRGLQGGRRVGARRLHQGGGDDDDACCRPLSVDSRYSSREWIKLSYNCNSCVLDTLAFPADLPFLCA